MFGNASLCGTEVAREEAFHAFQPQFAHSKYRHMEDGWHASGVSEGLFRADFCVPRTRASDISVVQKSPTLLRRNCAGPKCAGPKIVKFALVIAAAI